MLSMQKAGRLVTRSTAPVEPPSPRPLSDGVRKLSDHSVERRLAIDGAQSEVTERL